MPSGLVLSNRVAPKHLGLFQFKFHLKFSSLVALVTFWAFGSCMLPMVSIGQGRGEHSHHCREFS